MNKKTEENNEFQENDKPQEHLGAKETIQKKEHVNKNTSPHDNFEKSNEPNHEHQSIHNDPTRHTKKKTSNWLIILGVLIVALTLFNVWQIYQTSHVKAKDTLPAKVELAQIELAVLTTSSCADCFDIKAFEKQISSLRVNITNKAEVDFSSGAGKALIEKYKIEKIPAIIIKGDISKSPELSSLIEQAGAKAENVFVIPALNPPYMDPKTNQVLGRLTVISLTKENCDDCFDMTPILELLKSQLKVSNVKKISSQSEEGKILTKKYNITKVPTLIFSKEASLYPTIADVWKNIGTVEKDGSYIMRNVNPPYFDLSQGKVRGLITLTIIKDEKCKECYDAKAINKPILARLGLAFGREKELDVSLAEAQGYITKYKITKIPTILLSGDTEIYPSLAAAWKEVGSIESDKTYVFRKVDLFQQP